MKIFKHLANTDSFSLAFRYLATFKNIPALKDIAAKLFMNKSREGFNAAVKLDEQPIQIQQLLRELSQIVIKTPNDQIRPVVIAVDSIIDRLSRDENLAAKNLDFSDLVKTHDFHKFFLEALVHNNSRVGGNQIDLINELFENSSEPLIFIMYKIYKHIFTKEQKIFFKKNESLAGFYSLFHLIDKLSEQEKLAMTAIWTENAIAINAVDKSKAAEFYAYDRLFASVSPAVQAYMLKDNSFKEYALFNQFVKKANLTPELLDACYKICYEFEHSTRSDKPFLPDQPQYAMLAIFIAHNAIDAITALGEVYKGDFSKWVALFAQDTGPLRDKMLECGSVFSDFAHDVLGRSKEKERMFDSISEKLFDPEQKNSLITAFPLHFKGLVKDKERSSTSTPNSQTFSGRSVKQPERLGDKVPTPPRTRRKRKSAPIIDLNDDDLPPPLIPIPKSSSADKLDNSDDAPLSSRLHRVESAPTLQQDLGMIRSVLKPETKNFTELFPDPEVNRRRRKRKPYQPKTGGQYPDACVLGPSERTASTTSTSAVAATTSESTSQHLSLKARVFARFFQDQPVAPVASSEPAASSELPPKKKYIRNSPTTVEGTPSPITFVPHDGANVDTRNNPVSSAMAEDVDTTNNAVTTATTAMAEDVQAPQLPAQSAARVYIQLPPEQVVEIVLDDNGDVASENLVWRVP